MRVLHVSQGHIHVCFAYVSLTSMRVFARFTVTSMAVLLVSQNHIYICFAGFTVTSSFVHVSHNVIHVFCMFHKITSMCVLDVLYKIKVAPEGIYNLNRATIKDSYSLQQMNVKL